MSIINLGNQYITFDYRHPATGEDFNTLLREGIKPGIYSGGTISITGGNTVEIAPFVIYLNVSTDKMVRVETQAAISIIVTESTPVLSTTFTWQNVSEDWLDFHQRASGSAPITNEVCFGECIFTLGSITSIDYTDKTWGFLIDTDTTLATNNDLLVPSQKATKAYVDTNVPVGSIIMYGKSTAPTNYLICDGSAISRTTYATLYAVIGTAYGSGDGSTTFNLPNYAAVTPKGVGNQTINTRVKTGPASLGSVIEDTMQGFDISFAAAASLTADQAIKSDLAHTLQAAQTARYSFDTNFGSGDDIAEVTTDGTNGTPRTGTQTQDCTIGTNFCIRYQ